MTLWALSTSTPFCWNMNTKTALQISECVGNKTHFKWNKEKGDISWLPKLFFYMLLLQRALAYSTWSKILFVVTLVRDDWCARTEGLRNYIRKQVKLITEEFYHMSWCHSGRHVLVIVDDHFEFPVPPAVELVCFRINIHKKTYRMLHLITSYGLFYSLNFVL